MANMPQVSINTDLSDEMCFGCGQKNPIGLKLRFRRDGRAVRAEFTPREDYQGWPGIVHGGITGCLLDEAMSYATNFAGFTCVTAKIEMRLKRPAPLDETFMITSSVTRHTRKVMNTEASVTLRDGTVIAESKGTHFVIEPSSSRADAGELQQDA